MTTLIHVVNLSADALDEPDAIQSLAENAVHYMRTFRGIETTPDDWTERARIKHTGRLCAVALSTNPALPVEVALESIREAVGIPV